MGKTCETCRFWYSPNPIRYSGVRRGRCRKSPPTSQVPFQDEGFWGWPPTIDADWCGEHQPVQEKSDG